MSALTPRFVRVIDKNWDSILLTADEFHRLYGDNHTPILDKETAEAACSFGGHTEVRLTLPREEMRAWWERLSPVTLKIGAYCSNPNCLSGGAHLAPGGDVASSHALAEACNGGEKP